MDEEYIPQAENCIYQHSSRSDIFDYDRLLTLTFLAGSNNNTGSKIRLVNVAVNSVIEVSQPKGLGATKTTEAKNYKTCNQNQGSV